MKRTGSLLLISISVLLFISCATTPEDIAGPPMAFPKPKKSIINIPVEIPTKQLVSFFNKQMPVQLYSKSNIKTGSNSTIDIQAHRGKVTAVISGGRVIFNIPVTLNGKAHIIHNKRVSRSGLNKNIKVKHSESFKSSLTIKYFHKLNFSPDWRVIPPRTTKDSFKQQGNPDITIKGIRLPLAKFSNDRLIPRVKVKIPNLSKHLNKIFDLKKKVIPVWKQICEPFRVLRDPPVYIQVRPLNVTLPPLSATGSKLYANLCLEAVIVTTVGPKPSGFKTGPLPELHIRKNTSRDFRMSLPITVDYQTAKAAINKKLDNTSFKIDNTTKIHTSKPDIYGKGDLIISEVNIRVERPGKTGHNFKARIKVFGKPEFDSHKKILRFEKADFALNTKNLLVNFADFLLHGILMKIILPKLEIPLNKQIDKMANEVNKQVATIALGKIATIRVRINNIAPHTIYLQDKQLQLVVITDGEMTVSLNPDTKK